MRHGDFQDSKQWLDDAITRIGGIYGPDKSAQKARSYFHEEREKNFIGEPYERVMAYYYRGILYWMDGEPDNARACFRSGELEDSSSEGEQYNADYVLLDYLDGLVTTKEGDDGSDAFARAEKESRFDKPPPYDAKANVLFFVEFGAGPEKYAAGQYGEELHFLVRQSRVHSAVIKVDDQTVTVGPYDDLGFQATTRGGRVMDYVLGNKAVFKTGTAIAGDVATHIGAATAIIGAENRNQTATEIGLGVTAIGLITEAVSASVTPRRYAHLGQSAALSDIRGVAAASRPARGDGGIPGRSRADAFFFDQNHHHRRACGQARQSRVRQRPLGNQPVNMKTPILSALAALAMLAPAQAQNYQATGPGQTPVYHYEQKPLARLPVLVDPERAQGIVDLFRTNYALLGSPRILIYVNRNLVGDQSGVKLSDRSERVETTSTSSSASASSTNAGSTNDNITTRVVANNTYQDNGRSAPTLADRQTVRVNVELPGRPADAHCGRDAGGPGHHRWN